MNAGYYSQQQRFNPTSLAAVLVLHGAVLAGVILLKGPEFIREMTGPTEVRLIPIDPDPAPVPPDRPRETPQPQSHLDRTVPIPDRPPVGPPVGPIPPGPTQPIGDTVGPGTLPPIPADPPTPPAVRRDSEVDPRYAGDLQPPYPPAEERAQRDGSVRLRITIGTNGRVTTAQRVSATSDAFWRATERQALGRWRFRPATLDGRPVESSKVMTVHFRIQDL
jgi:protein TonB